MNITIFAETTAPTLIGPYGRAWRTDLSTFVIPEGVASGDLTVAHWIVEAPWANIAWHSYAIAAVSLRDAPGFPPAVVHLKGATHEVMVYALDPRRNRPINNQQHLLLPANFHGQWKAGTDEQAAQYIEETVRLIIEGKLSPDTDYVRHWMHRFSDSNMKDKDTAGQTTIQMGDLKIVIPPKPGPQDIH